MTKRKYDSVTILYFSRAFEVKNSFFSKVLNLDIQPLCSIQSIYTKHRQQKFRAMNGAHLASPISAWLCSLAPAGNPIYCAIGHQIWGPLGKQDVCPNFALTAAKFVFSNSGNFRAKANPPKPRSCPNAHSGNEWGKNSSVAWATLTDLSPSQAL